MKKVIGILFCILLIGLGIPKRETETVYILCDVIELDDEDIYCLMPNGDIEIFCATDLPEEMKYVALKATDLDDYSTYEIVAIR